MNILDQFDTDSQDRLSNRVGETIVDNQGSGNSKPSGNQGLRQAQANDGCAPSSKTSATLSNTALNCEVGVKDTAVELVNC